MVHSFFQLFLWAGSEWVLWILSFLSVLSLAVIFDRFRHLRGKEKVGEAFWQSVGAHWLDHGLPEDWHKNAVELATRYPSPESKLVVLLAQNRGRSPEDQERLAQSFITAERPKLEKYLGILGTLGNAAPFIGLFGTVLGIIKAFYELGKANQNPGLTAVSGGLAEALVTTAVGLLVAIPSAMAFNYFQRKIKSIHARILSLSGIVIGSNRGGH